MNQSQNKVVNCVERLIFELLTSFVNSGIGILKVSNSATWNDFCFNVGNEITSRGDGRSHVKLVEFGKIRSRRRFALIICLLAEIHRLQLNGGSCTSRGLYYSNKMLVQKQSNIFAAKMDVCRMLQIAPWQLGILSAVKGLVAGDLQIFLTNGDVIDCKDFVGATALPADFNKIERLHTTAEFVLLVEKETVFDELLSSNIFSIFGSKSFILLTGKGYPDFSTRHILHHLNCIKGLPVYAMFDANPFGIEIMLVYRHGSRAMGFSCDNLVSPRIHWIGLHPSEIHILNVAAMPLTDRDYKKISDLLQRSCISVAVRQELCMLLRIKSKAEIESLLSIFTSDYIPNKIKRNLFL